MKWLRKLLEPDPSKRVRLQLEMHICTICFAGVDATKKEYHYSWHRRIEP